MIIKIYNTGHKEMISTSYGLKYHNNFYGPTFFDKHGNYIEYEKFSKFHNLYGPAIIFKTGHIEYWIDGIYCSKKNWLIIREKYFESRNNKKNKRYN